MMIYDITTVADKAKITALCFCSQSHSSIKTSKISIAGSVAKIKLEILVTPKDNGIKNDKAQTIKTISRLFWKDRCIPHPKPAKAGKYKYGRSISRK